MIVQRQITDVAHTATGTQEFKLNHNLNSNRVFVNIQIDALDGGATTHTSKSIKGRLHPTADWVELATPSTGSTITYTEVTLCSEYQVSLVSSAGVGKSLRMTTAIVN